MVDALGVCGVRLDGQRQSNRRPWAGTGAPTQALCGTHAARPLLSGPEGSPGHLQWWAAASAAVSQGTLTLLPRLAAFQEITHTIRAGAVIFLAAVSVLARSGACEERSDLRRRGSLWSRPRLRLLWRRGGWARRWVHEPDAVRLWRWRMILVVHGEGGSGRAQRSGASTVLDDLEDLRRRHDGGHCSGSCDW